MPSTSRKVKGVVTKLEGFSCLKKYLFSKWQKIATNIHNFHKESEGVEVEGWSGKGQEEAALLRDVLQLPVRYTSAPLLIPQKQSCRYLTPPHSAVVRMDLSTIIFP